MRAVRLVRRAGWACFFRGSRGAGFPDHEFIAQVVRLGPRRLRQFSIAISNLHHHHASQCDMVSGAGLPVVLGLAAFGFYSEGELLAVVAVSALAYLGLFFYCRIQVAVSGAILDALTRLVGDTALGGSHYADPGWFLADAEAGSVS